MKKLRIFSVLLLLAAAAVFGAFRIYEKGIEDHDAPVIACQTDLISVSVSDREEKLLEGVTANDSREGDLTSGWWFRIFLKCRRMEPGRLPTRYRTAGAMWDTPAGRCSTRITAGRSFSCRGR